jgi:hypothetical protein
VEGFFLAVADLTPAGGGDLRTGLDGVGCGGGGVPGMLGLEFSDAWEGRARDGHGVLATAGAWGLVGVLAAAARGLVGVFVAAAVDIDRVWSSVRGGGRTGSWISLCGCGWMDLGRRDVSVKATMGKGSVGGLESGAWRRNG